MTKNLDAMKAPELRRYARDNGMSTITKLTRAAELRSAIRAFESKKSSVRGAMKMAKKLCDICGKRPESAEASTGICKPCYDEGMWENQHNDYGHEELTEVFVKATWQVDGVYKTGAVELRKLAGKVGIKNAGKHKSAELRQMIVDAVVTEQADCWICHPELNEAQQEPKTRKASEGERPSRKGQVINVPLRATGRQKAEATCAKINAGSSAITKLLDGRTQLTVKLADLTIKLVWTADGHYEYAKSSVSVAGKARKVRNVAEALRILAGA